MSTLRWTFKELFEELQYQRDQRCIQGEDDMVIVLAGNEGTGKSVFGLGLASVDPCFVGKQIYYFWKDYLKANQDAIKKMAVNLSKEDFEKYNVYDLKPEDLQIVSDIDLKTGSALLYDESATQMFNRSAMTKANKQQALMFIANRFLRLIHILCVPKVTSLDKYIRNERVRFFILIVKETSAKDMQVSKRTAYVWSREGYHKIQQQQSWQKLFNDIPTLLRVVPPDIMVDVPNLLDGKFIKEEVWKEYKAKKILYNLKQTINMQNEGSFEDESEKKKKDFSFLKPLPGEDCWAWSTRTGRSPNGFKAMVRLCRDA